MGDDILFHGYARGTIPRENVVVLDNGSGYIKAGFAKDHFPRVTFPSIVGRPILRTDNLESGDTPLKDLMIGDECVPVLGQLDVTYPIKEGKVEAGRWEDMDALWTHTFSKLNVDPTESLVLLTEAPQNSMQNRIQYLETMFEHHGFRGVCLVVQAVLTLYANGQLSGVVLDSGDGVTHTMPVYESTPIPADNGKGGVRSLKVAGRHVTQHLQKLLESSGYSFNLDSDMELLKDIKEKCCFVSVDPRLDQHLADETTYLNKEYRLPDGQKIGDSSRITLRRERYQAAECLFRPSLVGVDDADGMSEMLFKTCMESPVDIRSELMKAIVLSGGTTMYAGLPSRLEDDMKQQYIDLLMQNQTKQEALEKLKKYKINIIASPSRKYTVFEGGAVYADIAKDLPDSWFSKAEYEEVGSSWKVPGGPGFQSACQDITRHFPHCDQ